MGCRGNVRSQCCLVDEPTGRNQVVCGMHQNNWNWTMKVALGGWGVSVMMLFKLRIFFSKKKIELRPL